MFGRIVDMVVRPFQPQGVAPDLVEVFAPYRQLPYAMLLLSGGNLDCATHSLMGWDPFVVLRSKGSTIHLSRGTESSTWEGNPFEALDDLLGALEISGPSPLAPFAAGGLGFLAYDLKNHLERLPATARDDLGLPEMVFAFPMRLVVHDRRFGRFWSVEIIWEDSRGRVLESSSGLSPSAPQEPEEFRVGRLQSNFAREAYLEAVSRIKEYIRNGDVYQVNLSQRFSFPLAGDPYALFRRLFALNPAPFYAYLNCRDFVIFSTSMERFLLRREEYLETRPIKGTRPRGRTPEEDEVQRRELMESLKDDAELSMIVDLLRNDLGKVCRGRTVRVKEHKRLEAYQNVYHLVSIVTGELKDGTSHGDILRATFPGGSITGCPKIRAMEIIDELEPQVRHVYTGAIGYLGLHRNLDLNVAIRTAIVANGWGHFSVGGGVVFDSDEAAEYEETLHKGRTLFRLIEGENLAPEGAGGGSLLSPQKWVRYMEKTAFVWINEEMLPLSQARVSVEDRGFLYGDGFFETLRVEDGHPLFLDEHLERLQTSAREFRISLPMGLPWQERLDQLLTANGLKQGMAAVKILVTRGEAAGLGLPESLSPTLVIWARPYQPPSLEEYASGWPVAIFPERRTTFLGRHKSLNYLFYLAARQYALDQGAREALILEADGLVSEGSATSLIFAQNGRFLTPAAASALPGVTVAVLARALKRQGKKLEQVPTPLSRVQEADGLWLANSLMGIMPVSSLEGKPVPVMVELTSFLKECLAQEARS